MAGEKLCLTALTSPVNNGAEGEARSRRAGAAGFFVNEDSTARGAQLEGYIEIGRWQCGEIEGVALAMSIVMI